MAILIERLSSMGIEKLTELLKVNHWDAQRLVLGLLVLAVYLNDLYHYTPTFADDECLLI